MKVLITGANGFLGRGIVKKAIDEGNEVIATDFVLDGIDCRAHKISSNIFEIDDPYITFNKPDVLIHLAWQNGFVHNSINHIDDISKHFRFIEKLMSSGIKNINILGTMHEIGFHEGEINEFTCCNPSNLYGISKNALRQAVFIKSKEHDVKIKWLRGFYIIGNSPVGESIFSKIIRANLEGKKTFPFTDGSKKYDFLEYDKFCYAVVACSIQNNISEIINISSGKPTKIGTVIEEFIRKNGLDISLQYGAYPDRNYDSSTIWGNNSRLEEILMKYEVWKNENITN
ncbi:nucleoside-diphosphate sugar epimerase [Tenericutes bacterium MZ-XQ]|nr:nucleoside-diphosphate sugar epimerase [Tenericutes bacterium MZ-XQ]